MSLISPRAELEITELAESGLFDHNWYSRVNPDVRAVGLEPLRHWYLFGCREARDPNRYFASNWYLNQNADVATAALNPLVHYLRHGESEGRRPMPYFDPVWYRSNYAIPHGQLALRHFLDHRTTGNFAPCPELYSLLHVSVPEGPDVFALALEEADRQGHELYPDADIVSRSGLLDINYYLINGADVHEAGLDVPHHFCRFGWREGRKPNIYFDVNWYLRTNPAVERMRINPVVHYLLEGESAGRRPIVYFDPIWYRKAYELNASENALAHYLSNRRSQKYSPNRHFDVVWYVRHFSMQIGENRDPFAHYLQVGTLDDIDPSSEFNASEYRRTHLGRPTRLFRHLAQPDRHNPLVHYLHSSYS